MKNRGVNFNSYFGSDVTEEMISQAIDIDSCVYTGHLKGMYDTCVGWWKKNPEIYVMLEDKKTNKIVGYINAMPINDDLYQKIRNGESIDTAITPDDIETYNENKAYKLYFCSIAIHPDYHNTNAFKRLINQFMLHIFELHERGINFSSYIADAVSAVGEKMCKYIGLKYVNDTKHKSKIFELTNE